MLGSSALAKVDGTYKYGTASGSFTIAGRSIDVGSQDLKGIVAKKKGRAVIKNLKIQVSPNGGTKLLDQAFSGPNYNLQVTATGPKYIQLKKKGAAYVGKSSSPIVVTFSGTVSGQPFSGTLEYDFNAKVKGKKLLFNVPLGGSVYGIPITGVVRILCKR